MSSVNRKGLSACRGPWLPLDAYHAGALVPCRLRQNRPEVLPVEHEAEPPLESSAMTALDEEIHKSLEDLVWSFTLVGRRYPLLVKTASELALVRERFPRKYHNDGLMQILRDSFDMLVIDLYSIREALIERKGLLNQLRMEPSPLQRRSPDEFKAGPITMIGVSNAELERLLPELQAEERKRNHCARSDRYHSRRLGPERCRPRRCDSRASRYSPMRSRSSDCSAGVDTGIRTNDLDRRTSATTPVSSPWKCRKSRPSRMNLVGLTSRSAAFDLSTSRSGSIRLSVDCFIVLFDPEILHGLDN